LETTSDPTPQTSAHLSTEQLLREAMNREAIRWISVLDNDQRDAEGNPLFDWKVRKEMFQMAQDWLIRSRKLWPPEDNDAEGEGVTNLRDWMNNPENVAALETMFKARGWLPPIPKKAGRPTKAEAAARQTFKEQKQALKNAEFQEDDSTLQALMKGKIPKSKEDDQ